jgi:ribosomal-protein-serine acetyltransferase
MKKTTEINCSDDLIIRLLKDSDSKEIFDAISKQRSYLGPWLPFADGTLTLKETEIFVSNITKQKDQISELLYVILYKNKFAGMVGLRNINYDNHKAELAFWIKEDFQYLGIMTEATSRFMEHCFKNLDFNRLSIKVSAHDFKALNVPKKLGFEQESNERQGLLLKDGNYVDLMIFGMVKNEYQIKLMFYRRSTKLRNDI